MIRLVFLVTIVISAGWSASHDTDEFGKRTGKTGVVASKTVNIVNDNQHTAVLMLTEKLVSFALIARYGKYMNEFLMGEVRVSVRVPRGTYRYLGYGSCNTTKACNIILYKEREYRQIVSLLRKNRSIKVAIIGDKRNYVFTISGMGFTNVYRKAKW